MQVMMRVAEGFCGLLAVFCLVLGLQSRYWQFFVAALGLVAVVCCVEALVREWRETDFVDRWTPMTAVWSAAGLISFVAVALVLRTMPH